MHAEKSLVMPEVKVCLRPVFGDIALPVLVRIERTGVNVDVRVEFLDGYTESPCLKKLGQRCRDDSFAQRRSHAA